MSSKTLILLAVVALAGYWYYQDVYLANRGSVEQQWRNNEMALDKCVKQETTMAAAAGMAGVAMSLEDATDYCAGELNLYRGDGRWKKY